MPIPKGTLRLIPQSFLTHKTSIYIYRANQKCANTLQITPIVYE